MELIIYVTSGSQEYGENLVGHLLSWEIAGG